MKPDHIVCGYTYLSPILSGVTQHDGFILVTRDTVYIASNYPELIHLGLVITIIAVDY